MNQWQEVGYVAACTALSAWLVARKPEGLQPRRGTNNRGEAVSKRQPSTAQQGPWLEAGSRQHLTSR